MLHRVLLSSARQHAASRSEGTSDLVGHATRTYANPDDSPESSGQNQRLWYRDTFKPNAMQDKGLRMPFCPSCPLGVDITARLAYRAGIHRRALAAVSHFQLADGTAR
jgi:hypothetical protein